MEPTGSGLGLLLVLVLVQLSGGAGAAAPVGTQDDAHCLCYAFSVYSSGPSWCEFLGMSNGIQFFKYSCKSEMAKPVGPLGMKLNATEVWNQWCEHWMDGLPELRKALLDNKENISKVFDSLSLQVHMMCLQESNGCHKAFWELGFNGQRCLRFDVKSRHWTKLHPGCRSLKETLESEKHVANLLVLVSNGDCMKLLKQSTVLDTKAAPVTATTTAPVPDPSKTVIIKDNIALVLPPIFILVTLGI